jgi:hypothetical protein
VNEPPTEQVRYTPTIRHDTQTDQVTIDWHDTRPSKILISAEVLQSLIDQRNAMATASHVQARRISAMEILLTLIRLGRRPNRADWEAAQLTPLPPAVRMSLLARKGRI